MTPADLEQIAPLAYTYTRGGCTFYLVPVSYLEPQSVYDFPAVCPIAERRGSMKWASLDAVRMIDSGFYDVKPCEQCEGIWLKAHNRIMHISGDTLARYEHAAYPLLNEMILNRIRPKTSDDEC